MTLTAAARFRRRASGAVRRRVPFGFVKLTVHRLLRAVGLRAEQLAVMIRSDSTP
jgi:hypothetical protein